MIKFYKSLIDKALPINFEHVKGLADFVSFVFDHLSIDELLIVLI